jgi:hypothetical protein
MLTSEFAMRFMIDMSSGALSAKAWLKFWIAASVSAFMCSPPSRCWKQGNKPPAADLRYGEHAEGERTSERKTALGRQDETDSENEPAQPHRHLGGGWLAAS